MIRLVTPATTGQKPLVPDVPGVPGIAAVARRALDADAALVVELCPGGGRRILDADGLSDAEAEAVMIRRGAQLRSVGAEAHGLPGFPRVLYHEARLDGIGAAAIWVLRRGRIGFTNVDLLPALARHGAVSAGLEHLEGRELERLGSIDPSPPGASAVGLFGLTELEQGGYDDFHRALVAQLGELTGATQVGVLMWDEDEELLRPVPGSFGTDAENLPPAHDPHDWNSSAARVFASGQPYLTNCAAQDVGLLEDHVRAFGFVRLVTVPLDIGGRRVGILQLANKRTDFTLADVRVACRLASHVAVGASVARMRDGLLQRERLEEILGRMALDIASGRNLQEFLGRAMDAVCAALAASMIALVPTTGDPLIRRRGSDWGHLEEVVLRQAGESTSLRVFAAGPRKAGSPGWTAAHAPVVLEGVHVGTLSALRTGGYAFNEHESRGVARLAQLVALAWATERYQRQLADSARVAERQRIADELHDHVAQLLFAARISLDFAQEVPGIPEAASASVSRSRDLLLRADTTTRRIMEQNAQSGEDRLPDRLTALVDSIEEEFARPVALEIAPIAAEASIAMSRAATNLVARAAREALVNAAKHAGPCQLAVRVTVTRRNRLLLTVTDGGIGVGPGREDGYGTRALRRAVHRHGGLLRVNAVATGGTKVAVSLPL